MTGPSPITVCPVARSARRQRRGLGRLGRTVAAVPVAVLVTAGGIGWLYLLRRAGALDAGPRFPEALPLQRLAGGAAQPLARLVAAWLPAGLVAGAALAAAGVARPPMRAAAMFAGTATLLLALGAAADAITASEELSRHVAAQPQRWATWAAAGLVALGAGLWPAGRSA
jgi:hypothetical protein